MHYDEFSMLRDNATEAGVAWRGQPPVARVSFETDDGVVSALRWGPDDQPVELVLVHGGAQNAHTWDTVALALDRPLLAIDLPGHGHSAWRDDRRYHPADMALAVAQVIAAAAPDARALVGMSLGGLTALAVTDREPALVRRLALVDITPGVNGQKAADVHAFVSGPASFASFDELLERTVRFNPTRSESSLRRGILHNAAPQPDGSWAWRYDRRGAPGSTAAAQEGTAPDPSVTAATGDLGALWEAVSASRCPLLLARGDRSPVVDDADVAELLRRRPDAEVVIVEGAGHSIQGDRPVELAGLLARFVA